VRDLEVHLVKCRYLRRNDEQCIAKAMDSSPGAVTWQQHATTVMRLLNDRLKGMTA
jgi:hypothetical protein